ncbi:MAG: DUF3090 domain-containing protein [Chloroflexi bacterium]|nr:DUF3090 domain-containing protein [Chloroflexota bacterium]
MSEPQEIDLKPVNHITTDAIGEPGKRVFYIQGWKGDQVITLLVEKFQIQTLTIGVEQFLGELSQKFPQLPEASADFIEEKMHIHPPVEPLFRIGEIGLGYDEAKDLLALVAREASGEETESSNVVRFWATRSQIRAMCHWGLEVASRGRPICPQCGQPEDPEGHFCAKKNGHKH